MADDSREVVAQVQGMTSHPAGTEVQVEVRGPRLAPNFTKELRARAHALKAAGVLPTARDSIEDITMGEIQRLTTVEDFITESRSRMTEARLYTVIVNRG